jgi:hypothetical protein
MTLRGLDWKRDNAILACQVMQMDAKKTEPGDAK